MSRLYLVRHAQASFLEQTYDKLSPLGEIQSRLLGELWARHKIVFDRVCSGPCVRQKDTAKIAAAAYQKAGISFPAFTIMSEFDEYQGEAVLDRNLPALIELDPEIRAMHRGFQDSTDAAARRRTFQKLFETVIGKWVDGEVPSNSVESWRDFSARVNAGFTAFLGGGSANERVALFTSGGPIGLAVQRALELSSRNALRVSWMAQNCSVSEFLYSSDRFTMSSFNAVPHLDDASLQTYR
ncbi:MAG TPA: histidine phosphatase family protein [Candidatus Acidoferrales bacterium]